MATSYFISRQADDMLAELNAANDEIDAWIHAAAVLDYVVKSPLKENWPANRDH